MNRTGKLAQLMRLSRLAAECERTGMSAQDAIEQDAQRRAPQQPDTPQDAGRRRLAQGVAAAAVATGAGLMSPMATAKLGRLRRKVAEAFDSGSNGGGVAIVGAGIAGLSCGYELARHGVAAKVYEASGRVGGRCFSLRDVFPGQVAERGAEFIGASHHTMLGYARAFGLQLEDYSAVPGAAFYHFEGRTWTEAQVLDEFRGLAASMRSDLADLGSPTADRFSEADQFYDLMTLDEYLTVQGAGSLLRKVIGAAFRTEYGAGIDEVGAISFLRLAQSDRRGKFAQVGAFGGEGFHVVDGNDRIATELAARLSSPVQVGHRLVAMRRMSGGAIRLTFDIGGRRVQADHDAVVLALPFSVLREVELDDSLDLPTWKLHAIRQSALGDSTKLMVGFREPYWSLRHGSSGTGYGDRERLQSTWESNPTRASERHALLTAQIGGAQARAMDPRQLQGEAFRFLNDLDIALPGAYQSAQRTARGDVVAAMYNWSRNPLSKGAYTCQRPGYFTTIAHHEAKPVGKVLFAGEHTSSFYEWQGFMEGAALSGLRAAGEAMALANTGVRRRFAVR